MSKIIGIDTGVTTGIAVWDIDEQRLLRVSSMKIHQAFEFVLSVNPVFVRVEDARLFKHCGRTNRAKTQGAGSVKRDAVIWEDFLTDKKIMFEMVSPIHNITKLSAKDFERRTGWTKTTNEHGRDAAGLVVNFTARNLAYYKQIRG